MTNPEIASQTEKLPFLDTETLRGKHRIASAFVKAMTRFHRDQKGEEGPGCLITIVVASMAIMSIITAVQTVKINELNKRISAVETPAATHTPTSTPTLSPVKTPIK